MTHHDCLAVWGCGDTQNRQQQMRIGSLFTGAAGLDRAVEQVTGGRVVWVCEHEPATVKNPRPRNAAAKLLAYRYPHLPNLGDITKVDWTLVEPVDALCGGYPCQPFSDAGQRKGTDDERYLWPEVERAIRVLRPRYVFLENVRGHLGRGFDAVLGSLAGLGFDAEWILVPASAVGAPHRRERLFVVATDSQRRGLGRFEEGTRRGALGRATVGGASAVGDASGITGSVIHGDDVRAGCRADRRVQAAGTGFDAHAEDPGGARFGEQSGSAPEEEAGAVAGDVADGVGGGRPVVDWGPYRAAVERWERLTRPAPAPTEPAPKGGQRLAPRFTEWMQGWPDGWVCDVPGLSRNDMLRICGNGVVTQQAIAAYRELWTEIESRAA